MHGVMPARILCSVNSAQIHPLHLSSGDLLREARRRLIESGEVSTDLLRENLAQSWQRSCRAGLRPLSALPEQPQADAADLLQALDHHRGLLAQARPVMEFVFEQMRDTGSLVVLADTRGLLLHSLGDAEFLERAERVALRPGALWSESARGTNAIGLSLVERRPVVIHGGEHFFEHHSFLTCAAAPIIDPGGSLLGVLDVSGHHRNHQPHTFALVRMAARMIEHRLFETRHANDLRIHLHPSPEGIGTVGEGLLAVSEDGWIVGANATALVWLDMCTSDIGAITLERALGLRTGAVASGLARHITTRQGLALHLRADVARASVSVAFSSPRDRYASTASEPPAHAGAHAPLERTHRPQAGSRTPAVEPDSQLSAAQHRAMRMQEHGIPVLLQGESGSGKEVFARELHRNGPRAQGPFVAVNCAALPETLIEAELFGHVAGAFTGARREGSPGRIREAHGGVLFLDEIGDMPLPLQARLLRVLQDREITPLGGSKAVAVDFYLVCATHRNLRQEVRAGHFREDLFYRLNGLTVQLPPLRERRDFYALTAQLLRSIVPAPAIGIHPDVLAALQSYHWPGNVRQLHNVLRAACAMLDPGETQIQWPHMPDDLLEDLNAYAPQPPKTMQVDADGTDLRSLSDRMIEQVLEATQGNMSEAARRLGISRNTLYRRLKRSAAG